jgi:diguanylate cyclase (GGDEF)-like protein
MHGTSLTQSADPKFKRLRYFYHVGVILVVLSVAILFVFDYRLAIDKHITNVEQKNILAAQAVRTVLWQHSKMLADVNTQTANKEGPLSETVKLIPYQVGERQLELPADVNKLLLPLITRSRIKKLKIFDLDGMTLYSTRVEEVGESHSWSQGFRQAAAGLPYSVLVTEKEMHEALPGGTEYVETYYPVFAFPDNEVIGAVELYTDVGAELATIRSREKKEAGALALIFTFIFGLFAYADRSIHRQDLQRAQQLIHLATHDSLTNLPNGSLLRERLAEALEHAKPRGGSVAVLFIDLDRLQLINDNLGHDIGDYLIKVIAERLSALAHPGDTVGRFGNEFVMVIPELETADFAIAVIKRIMHQVKRPVSVADQQLIVSCTIGASLYPRDASDVGSLLKCADIAMHQAKKLGGNNYRFFNREMDTGLSKKMHMSSALQGAVERGELVLHYQPQFDLRTGRLVAAEALVRWQRPNQRLIPPSEFIGLAEDIGLIESIGEWVLTTACEQTNAWHMEGFPLIRVAVNLSVRQLDGRKLLGTIETALADSGLEPHCLDLELTESLIMREPAQSITTCDRIKDLGVCLSIDDFGTGYSSLNWLKRFPLDQVKIDKSFVRDLITNPDDNVIALTIISMAHGLKLKVVAEGVETIEQLHFLRANECDMAQGFYLGAPIPAAKFSQLLREQSPMRAFGKDEQEANTSSAQNAIRLIKSEV